MMFIWAQYCINTIVFFVMDFSGHLGTIETINIQNRDNEILPLSDITSLQLPIFEFRGKSNPPTVLPMELDFCFTG